MSGTETTIECKAPGCRHFGVVTDGSTRVWEGGMRGTVDEDLEDASAEIKRREGGIANPSTANPEVVA